MKIGVPRRRSGCSSAITDYASGLRRGARPPGAARREIVEIDIEPFYETARLLYDGPWVAERTITARSLLASDPDAIHPVTREIILERPAPDARSMPSRRSTSWKSCAAIADHTFRKIDALALPTAPTDLHRQAGAGRSDPAQQPARHLHQFRQPARSLRPRAAGVDDAKRRAVRHHAAGAGRRRRAARRDRPRVPCRHGAAARRAQAAAAAARRHCRNRRRAARSRSPSSARICRACRSTANCARSAAACWRPTKTAPDYRLYALDRYASRQNPACCASTERQRRSRSRSRSGRFRSEPSAASSTRFRRRCRSARSR